MKKTKKLFLTIGSATSVVMPLATIIACNNSSNGNPSVLPKQEEFKLPTISLKLFKEYFESNKNKYSELTKENIASISVKDILDFSQSKLKDEKKSKIFTQIEEFLINFSFDKNGDKDSMEEVLRFIQNLGLTAYTTIPAGSTRSPVRGNIENGLKVYNRRDLGFVMQKTSGHLDIMHATPAKIDGKIDNIFQDYNKSSKSILTSRRILDSSFSSAESYSGNASAGATFSLFREFTTGVDEKDSTGKWVSERKTINELAKGFLIKIETKETPNPKWRTYSSADKTNLDYKAVRKRLWETVVKISFKLDDNIELYYSKPSKGEVIKTDQKFVIKDLYYGLVRNLMASKNIRGYTTIDKNKKKVFHPGTGIKNKSGKQIIDAFTQEEQELIDSQTSTATNNRNTYLFDLNKVDIGKTIEANISNSEMGGEHGQFDLIFDEKRPSGISPDTTLQLLTNTGKFDPVPSSIIDERYTTGGDKFKGKTGYKFGIINYGKNIASSDKLLIDKMDYYSIAPYIYTDFNLNENAKTTIKKNKFYVDKTWAKNSNTLTQYTTVQRGAGDISQFQTVRKSNYMSAKDHEYILNGSVRESKVYIEEIENAGKYAFDKSSEMLLKNISIQYAVYGGIVGSDKYYNDLGRKMMFGYSTKEEIIANNNSISDFFTGNGRKLRSMINSAVNWYTYVQTAFPGQNKEFYASYIQSEMIKYSKIPIGSPMEENSKKDSITKPDFLPTYDTLKNIYWHSNFSIDDQFKSSMYKSVAKKIDDLAKSIGATKSKPAKIPLASWVWVGSTTPESIKLANNNVLKVLNSLSDRIIFNFSNDKYTWTDFYNSSTRGENFLIYSTFGPDYNGVGSLFQQFVGSYGANIYIEIFRRVFGITSIGKGRNV